MRTLTETEARQREMIRRLAANLAGHIDAAQPCGDHPTYRNSAALVNEALKLVGECLATLRILPREWESEQ